MIYKILNKYRELILYCLIGCIGAGLDFITYVSLTGQFCIHYQLANFISVSLGIINNFFLNCFFNFKAKDKILIRFVCFYVVGIFGWILSALCLWICIEQFGINIIISKLGTILFVTLLQFCLNKFISFRKTNSKKEYIDVR